ncbi:SDR family oxidoreductase [Pseudoxanthomonas sp.]|uniref:SDR family oxidoreductase n=1 Tax=Pseudoxanthomonas sp. TaxID=1871049 RepID=UPI00258C4046|nr:SDR family oxidoreductase [Pseudoxanthomonas sp.]MCR6686384.1 SDR family oxidoreductase [Pseudoxanthomonas sp.]
MLVAGGRGMIGGAVARRLAAAGHELVHAGRRETDGDGGLRLDFAAPPGYEALVERLRGIDLVVNAVGIFQAQGKQSFDAVHVNGPRRLFEAAVGAGVRRFVHVSALGARADADTAYFASKGEAEAWLRSLPGRVVVVRPSLVFSPDGASTRVFLRLATAPLSPLPDGGHQPVQPIHLDDLADAIVAAALADGGPATFDAVGPRALPLRGYLQALARPLGHHPRFVSVPVRAIAPLLPLAERLSGGLAGRDALRMLQAGNTGDPSALARVLGRLPRDPDDFIGPETAARLRAWLRRRRAVAAMRLSLAAMWLGTAWVSLYGYPRAASHALLARLGLHGAWADLALWSGALLDAALGLALLALPRRRRVYQAQLVLVGAYTVLISVWLPEFWLHPFGPLLKNIPILAMIAALLVLDHEDDHRPGDG